MFKFVHDQSPQVDDLDVFALWVNGALQAGSNIDENSLAWCVHCTLAALWSLCCVLSLHD